MQLLYCLDETNGATNRLFMAVLREVVKAICRWKGASLSTILAIEDEQSVIHENRLEHGFSGIV